MTMPPSRAAASWRALSALASGVLFSAFCVAPVSAQGGSSETGVAWSNPAQWAAPGKSDRIPDKPLCMDCVARVPGKTPEIPAGPMRSLNNDGPSEPPTMPGATVPTAGAFTTFYNTSLGAAAASKSNIGEPTAALNRDIALYTGNWYASLSEDNGRTWSYINPYTKFPASAGGFCCDQFAFQHTYGSAEMTIWLLQYVNNAAGNINRIAIANSRDNARNASFYYYDFSPQNVGYAAGAWFDFPHLATGSNYLYMASNVFNSSSSYLGSVVLRLPLAQLSTAAGFSYNYASRNDTSSYRLTQGAGTTMFWGSHVNTSTFRVYRWDEASTGYTWNDRGITTWFSGSMSNVGPDGNNWMLRGDHRTLAAAMSGGLAVFGWHSAPGGGRPNPYVHFALFNTSDSSLNSERIVWSSGTSAWGYPALGANSASGEWGGVVGFGSSTSCVGVAGFIRDAYEPWSGGFASTYIAGPGTNNMSGGGWGDYFSVIKNPYASRTFVATGMSQQGGSGGSFNTPRYVWFGRDDFTPTWVDLNVTSSPVAASITVDQTDRNGAKNGVAPFTRSYPPRQGYTLTAPSSVVSGSTTYLFRRWVSNGLNQTDFVTTLDVPDIGAVVDTADAIYDARRTLSISSTNPASGVSITVTPTDLNGNGTGPTPLSRLYRSSETVSLTAPTAVGLNPFKWWRINGLPGTPGVTSVNVLMSTDTTAVAEYFNNVTGTATVLGVACKGSNNLFPSHTCIAASGEHNINTTINFNLASARAFSPAALYLGGSKTSFPPFTLPLDLGPFGMPTCFLYTSIDINLSAVTTGAGAVTIPTLIPNNTALVGAHVYSQFAIVDPGANLLNVVHSNAIDVRVGGNL